MKQETCGKPEKGLPKQEKSRESEGQRKRLTYYRLLRLDKAHFR